MEIWVGYSWFIETYGIKLVQRLRTRSCISKISMRHTETNEGYTKEYFPETFMPEDSFAGHFTFALKYEGVHFELYSRLFDKINPDELETWILKEPSGQYARRACFFYEWITGKELNFDGVRAGNYVNALDEKKYFTGQSQNNSRWRVRDNIPGNSDFAPIVTRLTQVIDAEEFKCSVSLSSLESEFGPDIIQRSTVWLTVKESRASFAIEREEKQVDRIRRFAAVMENRCGSNPEPLDENALASLQEEILGPQAIRYGLRRSPVFIGQLDRYVEIIHYIAPPSQVLSKMIGGLRAFHSRTVGKSAIVRAAVISFGFVYIHPMSDGNGRMSRFLINDTLRRDGSVPAPFILPVSATITGSIASRKSYDDILEVFSRPFMTYYNDSYRFGDERVEEDGVRTNFEFDRYEDALHAWRYPDLTDHAIYMHTILKDTIDVEMRKEARHIRQILACRASVKEVLDGPDQDIDRIVRSIRENNGKISQKLKKEFPQLGSSETGNAIVKAINKVLSALGDS